MTNTNYFIFTAVMITLVGCSDNTADGKMEIYSRTLYDKAISNSKYCDALQVTKGRFEYIDDNQTSHSKLKNRMDEWEDLAKKVELDCRKEKWPSLEEKYKKAINGANTYLKLYKSIKIQMRIAPAKKDDVGRSCIHELKITNNSDTAIAEISAFLFYKHSVNHVDFAPIKWPQQSGGLALQTDEERIQPKETREITFCKFFFKGELERPLINLNKVDKTIKPGTDGTHAELPLTSIDDMQGEYMNLQLASVTLRTNENFKEVKFSSEEVIQTIAFIKQVEKALKEENPF